VTKLKHWTKESLYLTLTQKIGHRLFGPHGASIGGRTATKNREGALPLPPDFRGQDPLREYVIYQLSPFGIPLFTLSAGRSPQKQTFGAREIDSGLPVRPLLRHKECQNFFDLSYEYLLQM